jgi:hypothetical protein
LRKQQFQNRGDGPIQIIIQINMEMFCVAILINKNVIFFFIKMENRKAKQVLSRVVSSVKGRIQGNGAGG